MLLFDDDPKAKYAFVFVGAFILIQSLFTNYEGGLVKIIPVKFHLTMDVLLGIALILSPWLFGFAEQTWLWHVLMGGMSVFAGLFTSSKIPEFLSMKGM
ncbi:SPW repeat domain-containing protein [Sphingobacterium deserti]|uniref:SPW repeat domain-containing protein n=1 Tax=Sphingobacterium deserti TaxID=1229276 RepID=UPI003B830AC2